MGKYAEAPIKQYGTCHGNSEKVYKEQLTDTYKTLRKQAETGS